MLVFFRKSESEMVSYEESDSRSSITPGGVDVVPGNN